MPAYAEDWNEKFNSWKKRRVPRHERKEQLKIETKDEVKTAPVSEVSGNTKNHINRALIAFAFLIPAAILLYVLYINFLPFGYEKTYELNVDENGAITPALRDAYITDERGRRLLSLPNGINGQVNLVIEPDVVLSDARAEIEIEGEGVFLGTGIDRDLSEIDWTYSWDFTQGIPQELEGTAEYDSQGQCVRFDAYQEQTLFLPNSSDMFESGPMSIFVKWKPSRISHILKENQQIIGHYNWEIYQGADQVRFQVGRMNDGNGSFYSASYPITQDFFDNEHELLAIYSPDFQNGNGFIELYIDNQFAQRVSIGNDTIWRDYNSDRPLNFGWSDHNSRTQPYLDGCIYEAKMIEDSLSYQSKAIKLGDVNGDFGVPIVGNGNLNSIFVKLTQ